MVPEKLRTWLGKKRVGATTLEVLHEVAVGAPTCIASWSKDEWRDLLNPASGEPDLCACVMDACQDYADSMGESAKFRIVWVSDSGRPITQTLHQVKPQSDPDMPGAAQAHLAGGNAMVGQLLGHIERQQRVFSGSMGVVLSAYERVLDLQQRVIERQGKQIAEIEAEKPSAGDEALAEAKIQAWEKLGELGPMIVARALQPSTPRPQPTPKTPTVEEEPPDDDHSDHIAH